ncbi:hypothetical protein JRO89_XS03G0008600 [Xanthoceras sorbifolium]|uniref:Fatty acyl-CoA reductase n=1 Tax=Xanthoceras sorbifolium TaxID=99658 RepID=A0ABQ8I801_9ROSI|nr:hypothetical protein JRO89_XS03G0008600 [Xanthoceras sorbifolium]
MNSLLLTLPTFTAKNVQKPSNNQLSGYSSAPNMKYARMLGCRASAASDDGENSSLSSSVLMPKQKTKESILINENGSTNTGIGIVEFLRGKSYFITGGTGFLGKAIIEKLLRASPEVGKIYVLIKAANNEAAFKRLKTEIIDSDLFDCLRLKHGKYYEDFMLSKLVYVCGDVCESNLGMDPNSMDAIAPQIDVIINSAANTSFDERFDVAVTTNTKGPARLLNFAKKCNKLCIFIHISTAYVNRESKGRVPSPPPLFHPISLDVEAEMKLISHSNLHFHDNQRAHKMKQLGLDSYLATNLETWQDIMVGEMCMNTAKQWVRHELSKRRKKKSQLLLYVQALLKALTETLFRVGYKEIGHLFYFIFIIINYCPRAFYEQVPLDMVVNAIIVAMAKHGTAVRKPEDLNVYHVVPCGKNPLTIGELFNFSFEHFSSSPMISVRGEKIDITRVKFLSPKEDPSPYILEAYFKLNGLTNATTSDEVLPSRRLERRYQKVLDYNARLAQVYGPYLFEKGSSRSGKNDTQELLAAMSEEEKQSFGFDMEKLDWKGFFVNIHIPGLRKYVMKGRGTMAN